MKNILGVTFAYFIKKNPDPSGILIDTEQEIIQNYPLQGNIFSCDTNKILAIIKDITVDTDSETWIKGKYFG